MTAKRPPTNAPTRTATNGATNGSTIGVTHGAPHRTHAFGGEAVLLVTEPGPARTLLGRVLGFLGRHAQAPFLAVACGVLTPELLEIEPFDGVDATADAAHAPGARRHRLIEQVRGGTLYLDGIDHLTGPQQARLVEALPPRAAAGSLADAAAASDDVRLLATIGEAPAAAVQAGRLSPELLERFTVVDLRQADSETASPASAAPPATTSPAITMAIGTSLSDMEKRFILATLGHCDGDKRRTATMLGISLRTLYNRLHDWKIVEAWKDTRPPTDRAA